MTTARQPGKLVSLRGRDWVVLPSDDIEPAFLVYQNYRTIMRWNRSHLFAISLGHLADRISGKPRLQNNHSDASD